MRAFFDENETIQEGVGNFQHLSLQRVKHRTVVINMEQILMNWRCSCNEDCHVLKIIDRLMKSIIYRPVHTLISIILETSIEAWRYLKLLHRQSSYITST